VSSKVSIEQVDIDVEDWIDGVSFTQVKVEFHRNPALYAELRPMYDRIEAAEAELADITAREERPTPQTDELLNEEPPAPVVADELLSEATHASPTLAAAQENLEHLYAQAEELYARYDSDKEIWTLRALELDEIKEITAAVGVPDVELKPPPKNAAKKTRDRYVQRFNEHAAAVQEFKHEVDLRCVQAAVLRVAVAGEEKPPPTLEGLRRLERRPGGKQHLQELVGALQAISLQEVEIPAPKSLRPSKSDQE
jgi:hypothetical protein